MTGNTRLGSVAWSNRTGGQLSGAETRQLLAPLARAHAVNAIGRSAMALRLHSIEPRCGSGHCAPGRRH